MSEIIVHGTVHQCDKDETQVSASFSKRGMVVKTDEQYPQFIYIEFAQGKCNNDLDQCKPGTAVSVSVNLRGREWINPQGEAKYFNQIQGWRVVFSMPPHHAGHPTNTPPVNQALPQQFTPDANFSEEEHDDLPF